MGGGEMFVCGTSFVITTSTAIITIALLTAH